MLMTRFFSLLQSFFAHTLVVLILLTPTTQAGDLLRMNASAGGGSAAVPGAAGAADANAINTAAAAAQARANANDMLARNTMALQSVMAMQEAARALAATSNNLGANPNFPGQTLPDVPNGLGAGGLEITGTPVGATTPQQSLENARAIVSIQQTQQQALLDWKTFNVGRETTVRFDQSAGGADAATWIAFNRVTDPSGNPTQILGSIEAQGQVYIINQNGIIFGGTSVVNTGSLVASALPLNDNLVTRGLLNNPDAQFLFSANAQPAGTKGPTPAYTPPAVPAFGRIGNVTVQAGARITAPTSSANVGGRVALIGPNVTNAGTISTPDGQTVLAAGMQVGFDAHSSDDPSLRGLDVFVGDVGAYGGTATNTGLIEAPRGSVVIAGKNVNQDGFINSTTSAALNGRVDLLAEYNAIPNTNYTPSDATFGRTFVYQASISTGVVRTGAGSVVQIMPEYDSALKVVGTELALKSQVNMLGLGVYLGQGSVVLAPNANVVISAGVWDLLLTTGITDQTFVNSSGQVYLDRGAVVNVAGSVGIAASIDQYILTVNLRGAELADSALQRNGELRGAEVKVDLRKHGTRSDGTEWVGTPLANLNAYLNVIERNVGQLTVAGGTVLMNAGESVVVQDGAVVDVSSGYLDFPAGQIETTRLRVGNTLVDIADARLDVLYDGMYDPVTTSTDARWGVTTTSRAIFTPGAHYEGAHSYGARTAGGVQIAAAAMALDGSFRGNTVTGPHQLPEAPARSTLALIFRAQQLLRAPLEYPFYSPTPPAIEFRSGASGLPAANPFALTGGGVPVALRQERRDRVVLSPELLTTQGFGNLTVDNSDGNILLPQGVALTAPATGTIILRGANIDIQGRIFAPAGQISLTAYNVSPYTTAILGATGPGAVIPPVDPTRGRVTVGASAVLSAAGLVVDDRMESATAFAVPLETLTATGTHRSTTAGGTISIDAHTAQIFSGSLLEVSGGFHIDQNGDIVYANAGGITVQAGRDPMLRSLLGGSLQLDGRLLGLSGAKGGALTLLAPVIQIGGAATVANTLLLAPEFFSSGGFTSYKLTGLGVDITPPGGTEIFAPGVILSAGTIIRPVAHSMQVLVNPQGGAMQVDTLLKTEGYRSPVSLDFEAPGVLDFVTSLMVLRGGVKLGEGSSIELDALGGVVLNAQTVEVLGTIIAPGGSVSITGSNEFPSNTVPVTAYATVHLGPTARISTAGKVVLLENAYGRRVGTVHNGGSISVSGNIVAAAGAVLNVSGTTGMLDLLLQEAGVNEAVFAAGLTQASIFPATGVTAPPRLALGSSVATRSDSNAGSISLKGSEFLFSAATLLGLAGGPNGQGGTLAVSSGRFIAPGATRDDKDINLRVAQDISAFTQPVLVPGQDVVGQALGGGIVNLGYVGVNSFQNGGFDSLTLAGNVQFSGAVAVSARGTLKVADGGVLAADALTQLSASYVALGRPLMKPTRDEELLNPYTLLAPGFGEVFSNFSPTFGTGRLEVTANHIDAGFLSLQNIGLARLTARQDLRGNGYFDMAGHLTITAGQVYPTTASTFTITAYNYTDGGVPTNGSVTILSSGQTPEFPLSGGGRLNIFASTITQGGTLRAPLGSILLGWDGSGTAPKGLVTNTNVPVTQQVTLAAGSVTAVSAIDPQTGLGVTLPYGLVKDGTNWIDPTGLDITSTGAPGKSVRIAGSNVTTAAGSLIDIRGGGELYAYRWVQGNGGTQDILASSTSFAILPGYNSLFAPYGAFADVGLFADNLGGDPGYVNESLAVGDQIFLKGNNLLPAGVYTLLPARYALLPGAMLVTPDAITPVGTQLKPDGAALASGYRFNGLNAAATSTVYQQFEIAPQQVIRARSEFTDFTASSFIPAAQQRLSLPVTRVPLDAGQAVLSAVTSMQLAGNLAAGGSMTGRGGFVDVSSPLEIILAAPGAALQPGKLVLNTTLLSSWDAESLLIGGERTLAGGSATITVRTGNLTLDNAGAPLTGKDVILAATGVITLAPGAVITQSGVPATADSLAVNGNGALVRVSGLASAAFSRTGVTASVVPALNVGAGVLLNGASLTLDSTNASTLDPSALLLGQSINLSSGQISVQLTNPGALQPTTGLVLGGAVLTGLQNTAALSLLSYSSLDFYGTGLFSNTGSLVLSAGEIRGFNHGGGTVSIAASDILLDNRANGVAPGVVAGVSGALQITANTLTIGQNALVVSQYTTVGLNAARGIVMQGSGSFRVRGDLNVVTPFFTAGNGATQSLAADGALSLERPVGSVLTPSSPGLGAQVAFEGASITANTDVYLPSGILSLRAKTGALSVGGRLDVGGVARTFFDVVSYTDAGRITLSADAGAVTLGTQGVVNVAAAAAGGDAGRLIVNATGVLTLDGTLLGQGGPGGQGGAVELDVGSLASFTALNDKLNNGAFTYERALRVRTGSVVIDGTVNARRFMLGVDQGSITVNGTINAAGQTGGRIDLIARDSVTLVSGSQLTVAAQVFDSAGKGGSVRLEAGAYVSNTINTSAELNVASGSTIDLSVAAANAGSALRGQFTGTLHLRTPQNAAFNDVLVSPINGSIINASSILVEGYRLYDLTASGGTITSAIQTSIHTNSQTFMGAAGTTVANYTAMTNRLLANNAGLASVLVLAPGAEIVNRTGNLTLGTTTSAATNDWNLATFRYGAKSAPGVLTLRAAGNLEFYNTLSDGFTVATSGSIPIVERMWMAQLTARNNNLPVNTQSWNYRMAAGADFSAVNFREVTPLAGLGAGTGSLLLGKDAGQATPASAGINTAPGTNALTRLAINPTNTTATTGSPTASNRFQVIRTGTGEIEIFSGRDVQLLNQFATIYTAGVTVPSATNVFTAGDFVAPIVTPSSGSTPPQGDSLGAVQQLYPAQYSMAGGNVSVNAQADIVHLTRDTGGNLILDSQRQLPNNWLMRRGYVDGTGAYGATLVQATVLQRVNDVAASTTWWVNFSNFFDGIAALGGGHVNLAAGNDVQNVSAHTPTNARAVRGTPSAANLLELGGGDLTVRAGRNIDGGVFYVERGTGVLQADGAITTNSTRSPSLGRLGGSASILPEDTWLPTTLFVGNSTFDISARGDILLGPVANTMLLPQGVNNKHWYKTYFSTYTASSGLGVTSLGGDITFRQAATLPLTSTPESMLSLWMKNELLLSSSSAANYQPWLRLIETNVDPFGTLTNLMPGTLRASAYSGDINLVGRMTFSPSPTGTLELLAGGSLNGLRPSGVSSSIIPGGQTNVWTAATLNLSDAKPSAVPGVLSPFAYYQTYLNPAVPLNNSTARETSSTFLNNLNSLFNESGSTTGNFASTQAKQTLHASGLLHAADTSPARLYAAGGDLSGFTLFSAKSTRILSGRDISDIEFYIQNVRSTDLSVVSAGRDIIAYNANSVLRSQAVSTGNLTAIGETPKSGDIQISGPGLLEVLAGRDINLGTGSNNSDGTGVGVTSIGNGRNPYLPFEGADIIIGAGMGAAAAGLGSTSADFNTFIANFATSPVGDRYLQELAGILGVSSVNLNDPSLTAEQQKQLALALFYLVLRDAGRDHNDPDSPNAGTYTEGFAAISALFPSTNPGTIQTQARDIRTKSGGDISILAPAGGLQLAPTLIGDTLAPPGIITEAGGGISIFTEGDVSIGISRIFTLRGGDIMIWSSSGDIAAGSSAKTVQSAPPTRVLIDPQSASVRTDLAGLATGGGIGVLATVAGVAPGNVDLIAPFGAVDAGDAGIRATGNLNIAATIVLNSSNISVGGSSAGTPSAPAVASPSLGGLASAASAGAATTSATTQSEQQNQAQPTTTQELPSIISVEVIGYGGGSGEDERKRNEPGE